MPSTTKIHHINCGTLIVPGYPTVVCHCLLLEDENGLALVDSGIGLEDVKNPEKRLGQQLIDMVGFQLNEPDTAVRQIERLGFQPDDIKHIVITHCDPDHTGGLADFPNAKIHVGEEELAQTSSGHERYLPVHFEHEPKWEIYGNGSRDWFGLEARQVATEMASEVLLIPLFGHTLGHCGVAIQQESRWVLHVGDAYYLRVELEDDSHPVSSFAAERAVCDEQRIESLIELQRLHKNHSDEVTMIGYHDITELPENLATEIANRV